MIKLNLETSSKEHEIIKDYLQENVNDILADKINNGVKIVKDNKTLLNKKDLTGFMNYASSEAKKLAEKGANFACVEHTTVFNWAIHYFEEDSIAGTLYNEDGTEYKPVIKKVEIPKVEVKKEPEKPKNSQTSFFDIPLQDNEEQQAKEQEEREEFFAEELNKTNEVIEYEEPDELFDDTTEQVPFKRISEDTLIDTKTGEVIVETPKSQDFEEELVEKLKLLLDGKLEVK